MGGVPSPNFCLNGDFAVSLQAMSHKLYLLFFSKMKALFFKTNPCTLIDGILTITFFQMGESNKQTAEDN